ncbi:MAG TPA: sulfatase-like hydrolase/transferase [Candidatus Binatia bacterium]|nr:sulfatase-like hydrolase/transferase [Candidatus Binatia bacterium]
MRARPVALLLAAVGVAAGCGVFERRPDVIVIVVDTLRADHVGAYGYARPTTPRIDALAREGVLYTHAIAPGTWTVPSHAALFTGRPPTATGARHLPDGPHARSGS